MTDHPHPAFGTRRLVARKSFQELWHPLAYNGVSSDSWVFSPKAATKSSSAPAGRQYSWWSRPAPYDSSWSASAKDDARALHGVQVLAESTEVERAAAEIPSFDVAVRAEEERLGIVEHRIVGILDKVVDAEVRR